MYCPPVYGILSKKETGMVTSMCAKKKTAPSRIWKLAGRPLPTPALTAEERKEIEYDFSVYRRFRAGDSQGVQCVSPAAARLHESAAKAVASFLCQRYAGRFGRETVIKAVSVSVSVPAAWIGRTASHPDFLMGAALWLLDYLEDACDDPDEYLELLPPEADGELEYCMPFAEDLAHSQETILRMVMLLGGREKAYRKEFRALLGLIDPDTAERLRGAFRDSFLDYMDRAVEIFNRLTPVAPDFSDALDEWRHPSNLPEPDHRTANPHFFFLMMAPEWICRPLPVLQEKLHSKKSAELLAGYGVDDPYGLCAAYFLLEWEGDALASLNALTAAVMICAMRHLPWAQDDFGARAGLFQKGAPDYRLRYEYSGQPDEEDEEPIEMDWRRSETQLFFLATGVVLPRNRVPSDKLVEWFTRQGVAEQRARELAWAAFMAYYVEDDEYRWHSVDLFSDDWDREEPPAEEICEAPIVPADTGAADAKIEELTRKLKAAQGALHDAERTANRLREQLRDMERKGGAERSELAQLRETLYQLRAGEDETETDSGPLVELPWQVRRRAVVFGGHDSWRKAVKPLLPGARFYDREELPDLNAIRGADVVWLQVNALSHKYYYRIIDAARKNNIPVRYFGSASAKKCAVQLALDELAAEKKQSEV